MADEVDRIQLGPVEPIGNIGNDPKQEHQNYNCNQAKNGFTLLNKKDSFTSTHQTISQDVSITDEQNESLFNESNSLKEKHYNDQHDHTTINQNVKNDQNNMQTDQLGETFKIVNTENVDSSPIVVDRCIKLDASTIEEPHKPTAKERLNKYSHYPLNSQLVAICARNVPLEVTSLLAYEYLDITCDAYARLLHVRVSQRDDVAGLLIKYITENNVTETEFKETLKKHTPPHRRRDDVIEKLKITPNRCKGLHNVAAMFGDDADVFLQSVKIKRNKENTSSPTYQTKYIVKFIEMWESQNKDNATIGRFLEVLEECLTESDFRKTYRKIKNDVLDYMDSLELQETNQEADSNPLQILEFWIILATVCTLVVAVVAAVAIIVYAHYSEDNQIHAVKQYYKEMFSQVCPMVWNCPSTVDLKDFYIPMSLRCVQIEDKDNCQDDNAQLTFESVLRRINVTDLSHPHHTLIEGPPGSGKSTLLQMIAYKWSEGNADNGLLKFHFVLLINTTLIQPTDKSIVDSLQRHNIFSAKNNFTNILLGKYVLFLIDANNEEITELHFERLLENTQRHLPMSTSIIAVRDHYTLPMAIFRDAYAIEPLNYSTVKTVIADYYHGMQLDMPEYFMSSILSIPLYLRIFLSQYNRFKTLLGSSEVITLIEKGLANLLISQKQLNATSLENAQLKIQTVAYDSIFSDNTTADLTSYLNEFEQYFLYYNSQYVAWKPPIFYNKHMEIYFAAKHINQIQQHTTYDELTKMITREEKTQRRQGLEILSNLCGLAKDQRQLNKILNMLVIHRNRTSASLAEVNQLITEMEDWSLLIDIAINNNTELYMNNEIQYYNYIKKNIKLVRINATCEISRYRTVEDFVNTFHIYSKALQTMLDAAYVTLSDDIDDASEVLPTQHPGLWCIAEVNNPSIISKEWVDIILDIFDIDVQRCTKYCIVGLLKLQQLPRKRLFAIPSLTLSYNYENISNSLGSADNVNSVVKSVGYNKVIVRQNQPEDVFLEMTKYYRDVYLDMLYLDRCTECLVPKEAVFNVKLLDLNACTGNVSIHFISWLCPNLLALHFYGNKVGWTEQHEHNLDRLLIEKRPGVPDTRRTCSMTNVTVTDTPGSVVVTLLMISYNTITSMKLNRVWFKTNHIAQLTYYLVLGDALEVLDIQSVVLSESYHGLSTCPDAGWISLLEAYQSYDSRLKLKELNVVVYSLQGLHTLIQFIDNTTLQTIRYGRVSTYHGGEITETDEAGLWTALANQKQAIRLFEFYTSDNDFLDSDSSMEMLKRMSSTQMSTEQLQIIRRTKYTYTRRTV